MIGIATFETEDDYLATSRELQELVDFGVLKEVATSYEPFEHRHFVETATGSLWTLAVPDHAFRGFLKKSGQSTVPATANE